MTATEANHFLKAMCRGFVAATDGHPHFDKFEQWLRGEGLDLHQVMHVLADAIGETRRPVDDYAEALTLYLMTVMADAMGARKEETP